MCGAAAIESLRPHPVDYPLNDVDEIKLFVIVIKAWI
jgi:hypothetical protein